MDELSLYPMEFVFMEFFCYQTPQKIAKWAEKIEILAIPPDHSVFLALCQVKIFANIEGSSLIVSNAGPGGCMIQMGARPQPNFYASYLTPTNGVVLLLAATIIMGVMWASCKSGKESGHIDGIPYQELEMSRPESLLSSNAETKNGWDQGWDSDWDEEHAIKSAGRNGNGKRALSRQVNGITNPPNSEGWGNDWDD